MGFIWCISVFFVRTRSEQTELVWACFYVPCCVGFRGFGHFCFSFVFKVLMKHVKFSTQSVKVFMHDVSSSEQIKFQSQKFLILL